MSPLSGVVNLGDIMRDDEDPTLVAADAAIEASQDGKPRPYVGMSSVGDPCQRKVWYGFRWATPIRFDAQGLKNFEDGHHAEDVQAARLRKVPGVSLVTHVDGKQIGFSDLGGHFKGHADGMITGILQAPKTPHVWEHKCCNEKKQNKLRNLKIQYGEKAAFEKWDPIYFAQAQLYMHYSGRTRHYLTCSTPGGRQTISVRTNYDAIAAHQVIAKAARIVAASAAPPRIHDDINHKAAFSCRWCAHKGICHGDDVPQVNCRTCLSSTAVEGGWHCEVHDKLLTREEQEAACSKHLFLPSLVPGKQIDADDARRTVSYLMADGSTWVDGAAE